MDLLALLLISLFGVFVGVTVASVVLGGFVLSFFGITVPLLLVDQAEVQERQRWQRQLVALGLRPTGKATYAGKVAGRPVWYRLRATPDRLHGWMHGWGVEFCSGTLDIRQQRAVTRATKSGDPRFDRCFRVRGEPVDRARLTAQVRARMLKVRRQATLRVEDGLLWCEFPRFDPAHLSRTVEIARSLTCEQPDPEQRLLLTATTDPVPGVRRQLLASATAAHPSAVPALARVLSQDSDPQVRAEAILALRDPEGLAELAMLASPLLKPVSRQKAARLLLDLGTPAQRARVGQALASQRVRSLHGHALALLRSVGTAGEAGLIELLARVDHRWLAQVVAALGEVGTIAAVPALRARQAQLSLLQTSLSQAIDKAVALIQSRSQGEAGRLALAAPAAVQGSLAMAVQPGAISLVSGMGRAKE